MPPSQSPLKEFRTAEITIEPVGPDLNVELSPVMVRTRLQAISDWSRVMPQSSRAPSPSQHGTDASATGRA